MEIRARRENVLVLAEANFERNCRHAQDACLLFKVMLAGGKCGGFDKGET